MRLSILLIIFALLLSGINCQKDDDKTVYRINKDTGKILGSQSSRVEPQYLNILKKDPLNYNALVKLGNRYFDTGQHRKAIEMYSRALRINPKDPNVRTDMGVMYRRIGDFDRAIKEFKRAAQDAPRHIQSRYNLGVSYYNDKKDYRKAADAWEEVLKIDPNHPEAQGLRKFIEDVRRAPVTSKKEIPGTKQSGDGWIK